MRERAAAAVGELRRRPRTGVSLALLLGAPAAPETPASHPRSRPTSSSSPSTPSAPIGWAATAMPRASTPALDGLALEGIRFSQAVATAPLTLPSHASILTGLFPPRHAVHQNGAAALSPTVPTLAEALHGRGYRTAAFVGSFVLDARFGLDRGFELYDDDIPRDPDHRGAGPRGGTSRRPGRRSRALLVERGRSATVLCLGPPLRRPRAVRAAGAVSRPLRGSSLPTTARSRPSMPRWGDS